MWVFNGLILVLLHEVVKLLRMVRLSPLYLLVLFFAYTLCIVCCIYLKKSARCNGQNVVLQVFLQKNILCLLLFFKFNLSLILPEELMSFKLSIISNNSVYINLTKINRIK